jgi:hypothetical protein
MQGVAVGWWPPGCHNENSPGGPGLTYRADEGNRTPNLLITNQLLCQLSYVSLTRSKRQTSRPNIKCACYHCSNPSYSFSHTTVQA